MNFKIFGPFLFIGSACLFTMAACTPSSQDADNQDTRESITRGHRVGASNELGKTVVAVVSDLSQGQALCTGSIISNNLILTAAHCVDDTPARVQIMFGIDVNKVASDQIRLGTGVYQNPFWKNPTDEKQGDLAIIQFDGGLPEGYFPVSLVDRSFQLDEGQQTIFLGYGVTNGEKHTGAGVLRMTSTKVIGEQSLTQVITDGSKTSVCFGDSGGPAFVVEDEEYLQWGVASSVSNQACNDKSVHTAVMEYLPWIRNALREIGHGE